MNPELELAKKQRFEALKNMFLIIDEYATPSLSPAEYAKYEEVKDALLGTYRHPSEPVKG